MKKFENQKIIFRNHNNDVIITLLNSDVNYVEFVIKLKIKTKKLKVKRKYLILQERNKRFLKLIKINEIKTLSTQRHKITKIDKNLFAKILKLK